MGALLEHQSISPLSARDLCPGEVLVDSWFSGEPGDPLAEDVLHDFRRPTFDGIGPAPEKGAADILRPLRDEEPVCVVDHASGTQQRDGHFLDLLGQFSEDPTWQCGQLWSRPSDR